MDKKQFRILIGVVILLGLILIIVGFKIGSRPTSVSLVDTTGVTVATTTTKSTDKSGTTPCVVGYEKTDESKVASEENPVLVTAVEKKCDGNWYATVDYLGPAQGNPETGDGWYFTNTNLKLRTFKVSPVIIVSIAYPSEPAEPNPTILSYLPSMRKPAAGQTVFGRKDFYMGPNSSSPVFKIKVTNGTITKFDEEYLP